jgi:kumamolisin
VLLNQKLNRSLGFINSALYQMDRSHAFRESALDNNGAFHAGYGWNPCCGHGSPIGDALVQALAGVAASAHSQQRTERTHAMMSR